MKLSFTITGRPSTGKNGQTLVQRKGMRPVMIKKKALVRWEKEARPQIKDEWKLNIDYPINLQIKVYPFYDRTCDLVGYIQSVNDFLVSAGVLEDDSAHKKAIVVGHDGSELVKIDKENPRVEIEITSVYTGEVTE